MNRHTIRLVACSLILLVARSASSDTLINTLSGDGLVAFFVNAPSGGSNGGGPYSSVAAGFTLPTGSDYLLDSVQLNLQFFNTNSVPQISLYDTNGSGNPGSLLLTFPTLSYTASAGLFTLTPGAPATLQNSKTYWIVAANSASVANSYIWFGNTVDAPPVGIATSAGTRRGTPIPSSPSTNQCRYVVNGTPVPEPASLSLFTLGLFCFSLRRRRHR